MYAGNGISRRANGNPVYWLLAFGSWLLAFEYKTDQLIANSQS